MYLSKIMHYLREQRKFHLILRRQQWFFLRKLLLKVIYFLTKHKINKINVLDSKSTLQLIINHELSFIRFGDGEFNIINGNRGPQFQRNSRTLQSELREVLHFRSPKNLICIPNIFTQDTKISSHTNYNHNFWEKYLILT